MNPKPALFISADSRELRGARELVAGKLDILGYEATWLDATALASADVLEKLHRAVDAADGVIQLIGHGYGAEPGEPHEVFGRISHTQYEALYARQRGKSVWFILLDDTFPCDPHDAEPEDRRELQIAYRDIVRSKSHRWHRAATSVELKKLILGLEDDLPSLRGGFTRRAAPAAAVLLGIIACAVWLPHFLRQPKKQFTHADAKAAAVVERHRKMEQALNRLPAVELKSRQPGEKLTPEQIRERACTALESELGIRPAGSLADELPAFAQELDTRNDATPLLKARAAYALNRFDEAEQLFLRSEIRDSFAHGDARQPPDDLRKQRIAALEDAGAAAVAQLQHGRAMKHYRAAAALIDEKRDPVEWTRVQRTIADVTDGDDFYTERERFFDTTACLLHHGRRYDEAASLIRSIIENRQREIGPEHPATLAASNNLAVVLQSQNKNAEAEAGHLAVLKIQKRALGPDHPDTLISHSNLAAALAAQGRHAEAEAEHRDVLDFRTRALGPDHPATLATRNSVAAELAAQGKYAEAEIENRAVLRFQERVLEPEHPDLLASRNNLAETLRAQGGNAQAEAEHRDVLTIRTRILGPEHPDTLASRNNLALVLRAEARNADAEAEHRAVLAIRERTLGPDHPDTLASRNNLAAALAAQGKFAEAETQHRATLSGMEKAFGSEHPDVFLSCANIALCLQGQGKKRDALAFAHRALAGWRKTLGEDHPYTKRAVQIVQELTAE